MYSNEEDIAFTWVVKSNHKARVLDRLQSISNRAAIASTVAERIARSAREIKYEVDSVRE